ncbi:glutathione peroxidase [Nitrincola tibetensis]|uniref:Glutathione peroxidase n=1 Tax=Nitrincola tibetensis TaxID=2219697 RepID=A0A364NIW3_9GAMM|nr:glutathione peroxidase [Nitrincola tibetensis]RAU16993.1 glutathione peroxidase [Nitrincola tibetensis]
MPTIKYLVLGCIMLFSQASTAQTSTPIDALLNHDLKRLHSSEVVHLKEHYQGRPLLFINTASHCGFTGQFEALEALHQRYKDRGLILAGFPSNSFLQESKDEADTARVCFQNFGVTFDMFTHINVRGSSAHPIFAELARQTHAPKWNFYKYLIDRDGKVVQAFPSTTRPDSREVIDAIEALL